MEVDISEARFLCHAYATGYIVMRTTIGHGFSRKPSSTSYAQFRVDPLEIRRSATIERVAGHDASQYGMGRPP